MLAPVVHVVLKLERLESSVERLVGWGGSEKKARKSLAIFLLKSVQ